MFGDSLRGEARFTDVSTGLLLVTIAVSRNISVRYGLLISFCALRFFCATLVDE